MYRRVLYYINIYIHTRETVPARPTIDSLVTATPWRRGVDIQLTPPGWNLPPYQQREKIYIYILMQYNTRLYIGILEL